ncbi:hypothetical protein [Helicobacter macacae]|nr:hypothetical protein [Helicobacter macacae]
MVESLKGLNNVIYALICYLIYKRQDDLLILACVNVSSHSSYFRQ